MNDSDVSKFSEEIYGNEDLRNGNVLIGMNTIEATKRFNLRPLIKKAYANARIRQAFDSEVDGLVISAKVEKKPKSKKVVQKDIETFGLKDKVMAAIKKVFPGKYTNFEKFVAVINGNKYVNIVCF